MDDPAVKALLKLCDRHGGWKAVGLTLGVNPQTIYQIVTGRLTESGTVRGVGRKLRERLEDHYPGWLALGSTEAPTATVHYHSTGHGPTPLLTGESQAVRLSTQKMPPPRISWEAVLKTDLPREFETELPDSAMAPDAPKGTRAIFVTDVLPEPGDWVLVTDGSGQTYFREYRELRPGNWVAHALNPAFLPLDSANNQLRVIAVFDGMRGRKARR